MQLQDLVTLTNLFILASSVYGAFLLFATVDTVRIHRDARFTPSEKILNWIVWVVMLALVGSVLAVVLHLTYSAWGHYPLPTPTPPSPPEDWWVQSCHNIN